MSFLRYIIGRKRFLGFCVEICRLRLGVIFRPAMGPARATVRSRASILSLAKAASLKMRPVV